MKELPPDVERYKQTPEFDASSVPVGLLRAHQTREGTWGRIVVLEGRLLYRILEPDVEEIVLSPGQCGVVEPTVLHEVAPIGSVRFYVEFLRTATR